jgi:hypothetical protein
MLAAFQIIGSEDNRRAFAHTFFAFEHGNTGVAVLFLYFLSHNSKPAKLR